MQKKKINFRNKSSNLFQDKIIKKLQAILMIVNSKIFNVNDKSIKYCEILLRLLKSRNDETFNDINEMIKLHSWKQKILRNLRFLDCNKFYDVSAVIKNVHIMLDERNDYYVNNYIN
jgi:hypothetical protein